MQGTCNNNKKRQRESYRVGERGRGEQHRNQTSATFITRASELARAALHRTWRTPVSLNSYAYPVLPRARGNEGVVDSRYGLGGHRG